MRIIDRNFQLHTAGGHDVDYQISDEDISSDPKYSGFISSTGSWIILKEDTAAGTYRYIAGSSGYAAAWAARADPGTTYVLFNELFQ